MSYKRNVPWTRQPQYPARVASNAQAPYSVWLPGLGDLLRKADGGFNSDTVTHIGRAYTQAAAPGESDVLNTTTAFVGTGGGFSMLVAMIYGPTLGSGQGAGVAPIGGAVTLRATVYLGEAGNVHFDYGGADAGLTRVSAAVPTTNGTVAYYLFTTGPRGMEVWNNGRLLASNTANPTRTEDTALDFVVGDCYGGNSGDGKYAHVSVWQKQISSGLARDLSANPWQVFEPLKRNIYVEAAASGDASLVLADINHGHTLDAATLTQIHSIALADINHGHTLDAVALTQVHSIALADVTHGHVVDAVVLTQAHNLAQADVSHAHSLDAVSLTQVHNLAQADVLHGHTLENLVLNTDATLAVANIAHGHTLDAVALTQIHNLAQADVSHAHVVDAVSLTQAHNLVQADVAHTHTLDAVTLTVGGVTLSLDIVLHAHTLDSITFTQTHNLALADVSHSHTLENVILNIDGVLISAPDIIFTVPSERRIFTVPSERRIFHS